MKFYYFFLTRSKGNKEYLLNVGSAKIPVYCHMTKHMLDACGGGGWTLVMKIDGSKVLKVQCYHKQFCLSATEIQTIIKVNKEDKSGSSKCRFHNS